MRPISKRKPVSKIEHWRRTLSIQSLQMMVLSGVVRRADLDPPQDQARAGYWRREVDRAAIPQESASEQGWISRMILGRKSHTPSMQRP